jgi:hypothetical protein
LKGIEHSVFASLDELYMAVAILDYRKLTAPVRTEAYAMGKRAWQRHWSMAPVPSSARWQ